jgi:hypothetical protein
MNNTYSSRKFLLCGLTLGIAMVGWVYALLANPEVLATISTFAVSVLGVYAGANISDSIFGARFGYARKQPPTEPKPGDPNVGD